MCKATCTCKQKEGKVGSIRSMRESIERVGKGKGRGSKKEGV